MESGTDQPTDLRDQALQSLKKKQGFKAHLITYLAVNLFLVAIWLITSGGDELFWPIFPILGWGIGLAANAWDAYGRKPITEDDIRAESERLRARGAPASEQKDPGFGDRPVP